MIPLGILGSAHVSASGVEFGFLGSAVSSSGNVTAHTFTAQPLGAAATNRGIIVAVVAQAGVTAVTVAGQAVTASVTRTGGSSTFAFIGVVGLASGTTATVVVTTSNNVTRCGIGLWRAVGSLTVADTTTEADGLSLTVTAGDRVVACSYVAAATTWGGVTERYDEAFSGGDRQSGGDATVESSGTLSITRTSGYAAAAVAYTLS